MEQNQHDGWRDTTRAVRWLQVALGAFVAAGTLSTAALAWLSLLPTGSEDDDAGRIDTALRLARVLWLLQVATMAATLGLVVVWTFRLAANHVALARPGTRVGTPAWAIVSWLLWFVLPYFLMRELWKGSDPAVPEGSPAWKDVPTTPLVPAWFLTFVAGTIATNLTAATLRATTASDPDRLARLAAVRGSATLVLVLSAVILLRLAARLDDRQQRAIAAT